MSDKLKLGDVRVRTVLYTALSAGVMALLCVVVYYFQIPNPNMLLISALVISCAVGGLVPGAVSALLMAVYSLFFFSTDHDLIHFTDVNLQKMQVIFVGIALTYTSVGLLKRQAERTQRALAQRNESLRASNHALEEKASEAERVAELTQSVKSLLTNMPAMTFSKDIKSGRYLACNQRFAAYCHKADPSEVVGLTDYEIFDLATANHFVEDDRKALAMSGPYIFMEDVPDAAGNPRHFQTTKQKFIDTAGRLCTLGMCVDVTELMEMKQERAAAELALEEEKSTRVRESMEKNRQLAEALTLAEQANRAKTVFLSNMSHEIRTPMNAILGLNALALRDETLSKQTRTYLEKIGGSARHLLGLINDILDMSRIESGRLTLRREVFSFSAMLEQINTMVMAQCSDKGLRFDCRLLGRVEDAYIGDDMKLKEVLINILSNAIKFTEAPGSVTFTVERTAEFDGQSTLTFTIRDTGVGMDKSYLPKLFDPFTQENDGRSNKYGSTGLGMAISKNIVDLMNGEIFVESEKGVGTTFTVVVPLTNCPKQDANPAVDPASLRVLVVDDDAQAAEQARTALEEAGVRTDVCLSGREALQMMEVHLGKQAPYNLILLDWEMPELDGVETARQIRARCGSDTTLLMLTAYNWDEIMEQAIQAGVDSFLSKPLFASSVLSEFERVAKRNNLSLFRRKQRTELKGRRILLAEDMEINADILMDILSVREAAADHAENGRVAVELFRDSAPGTYDAILMDVRMPEMNGLEAATAIRAMDRPDAKTIPIIALTANAFDEDVQRSLQAGMNAHLNKPVEAENLYQTLEELIFESEAEKDKTQV